MKELFKDITGYEGSYQVSNLGNVKTLEREIFSNSKLIYIQKEKILKHYKTKEGYLSVILYKNSKQKHFLIHRLVAECFLLNKNQCVNHIDGNKMNNKISNLEWVTNSQNHIHAYETGLKLRGENCNMSKLTEKEVLSIRNMKGITQQEIANIYNVSRKCISKILNRQTWNHI